MTLFNYFNFKNKKKAFNLIEISISVLVLGIVLSVAVSIYRNYTERSALIKVINCLTIAREQIMRMHADQEQFPSNATMVGEINSLLTADVTKYISSIVYNPGTIEPIPSSPTPLAYIQANLNTASWVAIDPQKPPQVFLVASQIGDIINWTCYVTNLSINDNDIPSSCQII